MSEQEERNYEEMSTDELEQELDKALGEEKVQEDQTNEVDKNQEQEITEEKEEETEENNEHEESSSEESFDKRFEGKSKEEVERAYFELQKKLGEQGSELGELRKQIQEMQKLKEKLETMKESEKKEPEPEESFDPEKWQELLATDPEEAARYHYEKYVLPNLRAMEQKRLEEQKQAEMAKRQQELLTKQVEAFEKFANEAKDELGLNEDELNDFADFLAKYSKPDPEKGFYDINDLKKRYFWYNPEKLKASAAKQMLETVEEQAPKVKTLGGVQNAKTKVDDPFKDVHDIVEAEQIAESYSPEDLDRLLDELEE